jgi:phosphatidylinositol alpha-1,6-mannosyltransferase
MKSAARVLLIANNFPPVRGGSAAVYGNLARWAQDRMIVVAPRLLYAVGLPLIGWREHDRGQPYRIIRLPLLRTPIQGAPLRGWRRLVFMASDALIRLRLVCVVLWLLATQRVRTICIGELLASSWMLRLCRLLPGVRTVAYVHGEEITTEDRYDPAHRRGRRALLDSDAIVVVSRFTQRAVQLLMGDAGARVRLVENGVDGGRFCPGPRAADLVALYRLEGAFVFISVCRLLEKKGVDNAIRAFARVVVDRPHARFLVVGTGPYDASLRALSAALGVADTVVFVGQVVEDELVEHYRLGDVFVMPNRELANGDTEGFGLVFLEANSCGLPVIAGRDGGSTDAVADGVNGLVVDGSSVAAIAAAMARLHDDSGLRERLRVQGLAAAARAGWAEKTRAFLAICLPDIPAERT